MDDFDKEKTRRLLSWYQGKKQGPFKIDIELHRRCNLDCLSCSRRADEKFGKINEFSKTIEMPVEKWMSIVDQAAALGVWEWHIAGGGDPPYLKEVLFPVMKRIKEHNMYGILTTNGTNLNEEDLKEIVKMGWDRIHFSIDGPDAETHDYLRQVPGTFAKATGNIARLSELKKEFKTDKPMLNMNTVLSKKNYDKLDKQVELAHKLGVEYMFIEPLIIYSKLGEELKLGETERKKLAKTMKKVIKLTKKYKIDSNFANIDKNLNDELVAKSSAMHEVVKKDSDEYEQGTLLATPCFDPWFHMTIKVNGRTISCDVATDEGDNIQNKTLEEIWYGFYFEKQRKALMSGNVPDFCAQCNPSHTTQRRRLRKVIENLS